jgi:hypothetical protein
MYNALNRPSYNTETLSLMHNDADLFTTDCLCVSSNCKYIQNVILMGEEKDMNGYIQKTGRPKHNWEVVRGRHSLVPIDISI